MPASFFFNDTATTEIYTLSLHDALPIYDTRMAEMHRKEVEQAQKKLDEDAKNREVAAKAAFAAQEKRKADKKIKRSEEHTSELQSPDHLVCRLLLEKNNDALFVSAVQTP